MRYIITAFDYSKKLPKPLMSLVIDDNAKYYPFYIGGTRRKIIEIENDICEFKNLFNEQCIVNDFKAHVAAFNLDRVCLYDCYDPAIPVIKLKNDPRVDLKEAAKEIIKYKPSPWMKIRANAYQMLEERGVHYYNSTVYPIYTLDTFTGRSKTSGFNIQGITEKEIVRSIYDDPYFIHLDWVAADLRMAAIMSKDKAMLDSFNTSDPYTYVGEQLKHEFTREDIKSTLLKAFYSLNFTHPIFELFPKFREFCLERKEFLNKNDYLTSLLGRKFYINEKDKRSALSVFNSQFQGSVAHIMQMCLIKLYKSNPEAIFTEMHDSTVITGSKASMSALVKQSSEIMFEPVNGVYMPLKVSVGSDWKKWKKVLEKRCGSNQEA